MRAYEIIADPKRWTQGCTAVDVFGNAVTSNHPSARRWCSLGAILRTYQDTDMPAELSRSYWQHYGRSISEDNDLPDMTAAKMSERLRVVEEKVLAEQETTP